MFSLPLKAGEGERGEEEKALDFLKTSTNERQNCRLQNKIWAFIWGLRDCDPGGIDSTEIESMLWGDKRRLELLKRKEGMYINCFE